MNNISFNDGYKEYTINNDETKVIRINTSDVSIMERIVNAEKNIQKIAKEMQEVGDTDNIEDISTIISEFDKKVRDEIDYILGSKVCDVAFGNQSCFSMVGGIPLYERFLNAVIPIITKDVEKEQKVVQKRVEKYTKAVKK